MHEENRQLLSLDIWDTLIRRKTFPDNIKVWTQMRYRILTGGNVLESNLQILQERQFAERQLAGENVRSGLDNEHPIKTVYSRFGRLDNQEVEELCNFELETEIRLSFADPKILNLIRNYDNAEKIIISDFYFDADSLSKIVKKHHPELSWTALHSSSDYLLNKTGGLFPELQKTKYQKRNWIHVGDSIPSDINGSKKINIESIHYLPEPEHSQRLKLEHEFHRRVELGEIKSMFDGNKIRGFAIGLAGFSEFVRAEALRTNSQILFLEREGITLEKIYKTVERRNMLQLPIIETATLSISRIAVYAAYAAKNFDEVVSKFMRMYPHAGAIELVKSLGVEKFSEYDLDSKNINIFLNNEQNLNLLKNHCAIQETNFRAYFNNLKLRDKNLLLVDVGWMGSIQELLNKLIPNKDVYGAYLGMYPNSQLIEKRSAKSFLNINESGYEKVIQNVRPIEMLFMPQNTGSVRGYDALGIPLRKSLDNSWNPPSEFQQFMNSVIDDVPNAITEIEDDLITICEASAILQKSLQNFLRHPTKKILQSYLDSEYDESFGLGMSVSTRRASRLQVARAIITFKISKLRQFWIEIGWEEAAYFSMTGRVPTGKLAKVSIPAMEFLHQLYKATKIVKSLRKLTISELFSRRQQFWFYVRNFGLRATISKVFGYVMYQTQSSQNSSKRKSANLPTVITNSSCLFIYQNLKELIAENQLNIHKYVDGNVKVSCVDVQSLVEIPERSISDKYVRFGVDVDELSRIQIMTLHPKNNYLANTVEFPSNLVSSSIDVQVTDSKAAWIINGLPQGSGGHRGMFRMALQLEKIGIKNHFYILNEGSSSAKLLTRFREHFYDLPIEIITKVPYSFSEEIIFATAPATLEIAKRHQSLRSRIFYLVQDDEALFHPISYSFFHNREELFDENITLIASGRWMKERINQLTGRDVFYFPFPIDHSIYNSNDFEIENKKNQLLIYYKPEAARRLSQLSLHVVDLVKNFLPELEIVSFGSQKAPDARHGIKHLGQLKTLTELSSLYKESALALMFSPTNPSLLPYEMAACSLPVVDYSEPMDLSKEFFKEETGATLVRADTYAIAYKIVELFLHPAKLQELQLAVHEKSKQFPTEDDIGQKFANYIKSKIVE